MRAGTADRFGIAALFRIQRRGQQQFAHAEHAGHRRAHLVPERGQETRLGQRGLLGHFLLVQRQLPGMLAAQATAVGAQRQQHQQGAGGKQPGDAPDAAPPRRIHPERQPQRRRPGAVAGARLDLEHMRASRQLRQHALAGGTDRDPVAVVAGQAEAVADALRIDEREQPRHHAQVAVVRLQGETAAYRQRQQALAAAHLHALHAQRQRHRRRVRQARVQQGHAAVGGGRQQHPVGRHQQPALDHFLAAQAIARAERAHRRQVPRIDPEQAAARAQPGAPLLIDDQALRLGRRHALGGRIALQLPPMPALAAPQLEAGQAMQPQGLRIGEGERLHPFAIELRRGAKLPGSGVPVVQVLGGQPRRAVRRQIERGDIGGGGQAALRTVDVVQHVAVGERTHLHTEDGHGHPQAAVGPLAQPDATADFGGRVARRLAAPSLQRASAGRSAQQRAVAAQPQHAGGVMQHRHQAGAEQAGGPCRFAQLAAGRLQPVNVAAGPGQPCPAIAGRRQARVQVRRQAVRRPQHRQPPPVRTQVAQAASRQRHP